MYVCLVFRDFACLLYVLSVCLVLFVYLSYNVCVWLCVAFVCLVCAPVCVCCVCFLLMSVCVIADVVWLCVLFLL